MNFLSVSGSFKRLRHKLALQARLLDLKTGSDSFAATGDDTIQRIYVINLDRKPDRWHHMNRELKRIRTQSGAPLADITRRFSAIDARHLGQEVDQRALLPFYSLADQLLVEPNPRVKIDARSQARLISMTPQEVAVALSHIEVWKLIAAGNVPYTLVLEDDTYFRLGFARDMDSLWRSVMRRRPRRAVFDLLYLSFHEAGVRPRAKERHAELARRPDIGIWQASGYVLSLEGARKLLGLLPTFGPIDLWLNLQFGKIDVLVASSLLIEQRIDVPSTNSYSIMPVLAQIGVHTREKPLVARTKKLPEPLFVYGNPGSGLTALATALSVLGYTCCSDVAALPAQEENSLHTKRRDRRFNAYVNVGTLVSRPPSEIAKTYPHALFIFTTLDGPLPPDICGRALHLPDGHPDKWAALSRFLNLEYPAFPYPARKDIGQREIVTTNNGSRGPSRLKNLKFDSSPWIIPSGKWPGICLTETDCHDNSKTEVVRSWNCGSDIDASHWRLRDDTFPSNLAIFAQENLTLNDRGIMSLTLRRQKTPVRSFTSAAIVTRETFLYGTFSAEIRPSNVAGLITGIFLHRNSPHQEIDIEFLGKNTTKMLVNVFYNPGIEGTKLEYGYRGTPTEIDLGFNAAEGFHIYEIEWQPHAIRWRVDGNVVYERVLWNPTPIPNLPMEFNVNLWHSRSKELAGKLSMSKIPGQTEIKSIQITKGR